MGPEVRLSLPAQLRVHLPDPVGSVALGHPTNLREAMAILRGRFPFVHHRIMAETGEIRPHVNIFVDGEDVRFLRGLDTPLPSGSEILVIPSVSGG